MKTLATGLAAAFTLLEVMIAIAFIGIALIALLALQHNDLQSVIRAQQLTEAAMLAQALMSRAELERFPPPGQTHGDFSQIYPGEYPHFRWEREVDASPLFPDVARVRIEVRYGAAFGRHFGLTEFMHNPLPPATTLAPGVPNGTNPNSPANPNNGADSVF